MSTQFDIAHSKNSKGVRQSLTEHVNNVTHLAKTFASKFGSTAFAVYVTRHHDIGKIKQAWQERLMKLEAGETPVFVELEHDHRMAGAAYVYEHSKYAALVVAGHHGGLDNFDDICHEIESGKWNESKQEVTAKVGKPSELSTEVAPDFFDVIMQFSCLVDADAIDTSAHFEDRMQSETGSTMQELFDELLAAPVSANASQEVNAMRMTVRQACLAAIPQAKRIFRLDAPTGSGKTISGGLFATGHAAHHSMDGVIYVAPFRTIIDQTAAVYSSIFGENNVLPHHSTADFWTASGKDARTQRQVAENWDVPVIVTTSEQFFESFFSSRVSGARKLHNVANRVIIIDEPQALPVRFLTPCMTLLRVLVEKFGCTVLLMSATVPTLEHHKLMSADAVNVLDTNQNVEACKKRVTVDCTSFTNCFASQLGQFMGEHKHALSISNTKAGALRIYSNLPMGSRVYLSTWLTPLHRRDVVNSIRQRLATGKNVHVASTQVIEAGVDLDFPDVVLREKAPLDSLIQAFGRCNRNGHSQGHGYVFSPAEGNRLKDYELPISIVNSLIYAEGRNVFDSETLALYYHRLYSVSSLDKQNIMAHCEALNFRTVREGDDGEGRMRLIENDQIHLVCAYGTPEEQERLMTSISNIQASVAAEENLRRKDTREIQKHVISVFERTFERLDDAFPLALTHLYLNYYVWAGDYSLRTGLGDVIASLDGVSEE